MRQVTKEDVMTIIKNADLNLDLDNIDPRESLTEQGADSLDMVSIVFAFQEEYGTEITDDSIANGEWLTINDMVSNLNNLLAQICTEREEGISLGKTRD